MLVLNRGENHWMPQGAFKRQKIKQPAVLVVDPDSGKVVATWGANTFIMPHQIVVAPGGNVWVIDVGLHQAIEFDPEGEKIRTIGGSGIRQRSTAAVPIAARAMAANHHDHRDGRPRRRSGRRIGRAPDRGRGGVRFTPAIPR